MPKTNDGGPAFPHTVKNDDGTYFACEGGMSLRDFFAAQIASGMAAFSGTGGISYSPDSIAGRSYEIADAMLAEREKGGAS